MVQTTTRFAALIAAAVLIAMSPACRERAGRGESPSTDTTATGMTSSPVQSKGDPPSPESARADQLFESGEWRQALDAYYKLPPAHEVLKKRALTHLRLWEIKPALHVLRDARQKNPHDVETVALLAAALTLNRELDEALALYREVLENAPGNNNYRAGYALALAWSRDFNEASEEFRRVLASDPRHVDARLGLGDILAWQKQFDEAVAEYERAAAVASDRRVKSDALARSARALAWKGDLKGSLARYERALSVHPNNVDALLGRGETLEWLREYRKAQAMYEEVLRVAPEHPVAKAKLLQLMWVK